MPRYPALLAVVAIALLFHFSSADSAEYSFAIYLPLIQSPIDPTYFGIAQDIALLPENELEPVLDALAQADIATLRMPFHWNMIEPEQGQFEWSHFDSIVDRLVADDVELVGVIVSTPGWANGKTANNVPQGHNPIFYPPIDSADFEFFSSLLANRYRNRVNTWVLFNEPNFDRYWRPQADVNGYVELLCAGYQGVKFGNPEADVVGGALAGNGLIFGRNSRQNRDTDNFLPQMYAANADNCYDILAIHPYLHPSNFSISDLQQRINDTRTIMQTEGDNSPLWINEIGWSTAPGTWGLPTVNETEIAEWLTDVYSQLHGVSRIYWYNFRDVGTNPLEPEHHFGLLRFDYSKKSAFDAFQNVRSDRLESGN